MSSRRSLKKEIHESMIALYAECFFYKTFVVDADEAKADQLISEIDEEHLKLLERVNPNRHDSAFDAKKYYSVLRTDLRSVVNKLGEKLNKLA